MAEPRRFAFVLGCSRSGTSALVNLVNASEHAAMGQERYKFRRHELVPGDFTRDRFFDFRPEDTNNVPGARPVWTRAYKRLAQRWDAGKVTLSGDKISVRSAVALRLESVFDEPRFLFVFRDPVRVASSFTARARNEDDRRWPSHRRHRQAVTDWNRGFETAARLLGVAGDRVFPVRYETIFSGREDAARALYAFLGLPWSDGVAASYGKSTAGWEERALKPLVLDPGGEEYVLAHARSHVMERFDELAEVSIQRWLAEPADSPVRAADAS